MLPVIFILHYSDICILAEQKTPLFLYYPSAIRLPLPFFDFSPIFYIFAGVTNVNKKS